MTRQQTKMKGSEVLLSGKILDTTMKLPAPWLAEPNEANKRLEVSQKISQDILNTWMGQSFFISMPVMSSWYDALQKLP